MERVPDSEVVGGVPQGIFVGRSLLTGRAVCLLFLANGRITRSIPTGGLETLDWERHQAAHSGDCGMWQLEGAELRITWGDGGVHRGPLTVSPAGIEFYGKRYAKPMTATLSELAGRWEAAGGTAIVGGEGINRLSTLVVDVAGRYRWEGVTGGAVAGAVAAHTDSTSGTLAVAGLTMSFQAADGSTVARTLLPVAGDRLEAFTLDGEMFTRAD